MAQEVSALSAFRIGKLTERVALLERALIEREAIVRTAGRGRWDEIGEIERHHRRTLAENELVREGLVRPRNVREMEVRGNGQIAP